MLHDRAAIHDRTLLHFLVTICLIFKDNKRLEMVHQPPVNTSFPGKMEKKKVKENTSPQRGNHTRSFLTNRKYVHNTSKWDGTEIKNGF